MYMADMNRSNLYIIRIMAQLTQITIWIDDKKILNSMTFFFSEFTQMCRLNM